MNISSPLSFEDLPSTKVNGRTGRILNINYLTSKGLLDYPILFMSRYILNNKDDYYSGLAAISQRGNWNQWLSFMFKAIEDTSNLTFDKINDLMASSESTLDYIKAQKPTFRRPEELIQGIYTQPFTKVKHLTDSGIYAENTARSYLNRLADLRVLEKKQISGLILLHEL